MVLGNRRSGVAVADGVCIGIVAVHRRRRWFLLLHFAHGLVVHGLAGQVLVDVIAQIIVIRVLRHVDVADEPAAVVASGGVAGCG